MDDDVHDFLAARALGRIMAESAALCHMWFDIRHERPDAYLQFTRAKSIMDIARGFITQGVTN